MSSHYVRKIAELEAEDASLRDDVVNVGAMAHHYIAELKAENERLEKAINGYGQGAYWNALQEIERLKSDIEARRVINNALILSKRKIEAENAELRELLENELADQEEVRQLAAMVLPKAAACGDAEYVPPVDDVVSLVVHKLTDVEGMLLTENMRAMITVDSWAFHWNVSSAAYSSRAAETVSRLDQQAEYTKALAVKE